MIDFIIKLLRLKDPLIKEKYDMILIIVDRLTKYSYLIPFKEKYTVERLRIAILDRLIRYYGILEVITNDRDKLLILNY